MHINIHLIHFICVKRNEFLKRWVVFEIRNPGRREPCKVRALQPRLSGGHRFRQKVMVVAERLDPGPSVIPLVIPERRDIGLVEMSGDVVENRGGASASAGRIDDLHEGLAVRCALAHEF